MTFKEFPLIKEYKQLSGDPETVESQVNFLLEKDIGWELLGTPMIQRHADIDVFIQVMVRNNKLDVLEEYKKMNGDLKL